MWLVWINLEKREQWTTSKEIGHLIRKDLPSKYELNFYSSGFLLSWIVTNFLEILDSIFFGTRSVAHEYQESNTKGCFRQHQRLGGEVQVSF
jgi:hypothetical protein